jgi:multidrug efflux pump subunit AcrA (membrane-fusion protein)
MIDPQLSRLTDDLKAAEATLNSQDFGAKQARLVALEQEAQDTLARLEAERETLAAALENDEEAYEAAKEAITAYIAANYLESVGTSEPDERELFEPIHALDDSDEFSTPRANGAYTEDFEDFKPPARAD